MTRSRTFSLALIAVSALVAGLAEPLAAQPGSPAGPVPVERLTARRAALAARLGDGIAVLRSADERDGDGRDHAQDSDFRQDDDFFYLTGLETAGSWLVIEAKSGAVDRATLYLMPRDSVMERWTGPKLVPGPEATALTGIQDVRSSASAEPEIRALVAEAGKNARPVYVKPLGIEPSARPLVEAGTTAPGAGPGGKVEDLNVHLAVLRLVKDADEIARLRKASEISAEGHVATWRIARAGVWERELEAEAEATFRKLGAERLGYPSIVGAGKNGTTLHYNKNRGQAGANDLVVMDMGAEYGYYTADVTRTIPVSGKFTARQKAIYDLVYRTQQAALDAVRPGVTIQQLNQISRRYMRENSGTLCGAQPCDRYYIHGLSHWIGLDVHDVGDYATPLAPGMVFSVEPGIYIPEEGFGVRIEDTVLVTPNGYENLSARAPRTSAEVEAFMAKEGVTKK